MESIELVKKLQGLQTIESIKKKLSISRSTAIKYVHLLRKKGFVETSGGRNQPRLYRIKLINIKKIGYPGLYDTINKYSSIKIVEPYEHRIIGKKLSIEEALVRAIETKRVRTILASLSLFNHIHNWSRLYKYAKKKKCRNKVGALYELARKFIRVRRIDKKTEKQLLKAKDKDKYIIPKMKSRDFKDIEKKYNVFIPFNKADLEELREW